MNRPLRAVPRRRAEGPIHRSILHHLRLVLPPVAAATLIHIPNGEKRDRVTAAILKGMGVVAGSEDLQFCWQGILHAVEVKPEGAYQSKAQKDRQAALEAAGGRYAICRSIEDVEETLTEWAIPRWVKVNLGGRHV